jgi:hypothetical protein
MSFVTLVFLLVATATYLFCSGYYQSLSKDIYAYIYICVYIYKYIYTDMYINLIIQLLIENT